MELIRDIINEWDPICLFPMAPENEYENEIDQIYNLLNGEDLSIEKIKMMRYYHLHEYCRGNIREEIFGI